MSRPCPDCGGQGWVMYHQEAASGEQEAAYRLCGCRTKGAPIPLPKLCARPGCRVPIPNGDTLCGRHRAEWVANVEAEEWGHAASVIEALAVAMERVGLMTIGEALREAESLSRTTAAFFETERDRIAKGAADV